jgi:hypothetical protein
MTRLAPPVLVLSSALLLAADAALAPERATSWILAGVLLLAMALALVFLPHSSIRAAVATAGAMLTIALGAKLVRALTGVETAEFWGRLALAIPGLYWVITGNALPKRLARLDSRNPEAAQARQRFAGWTWVVCGVLYFACALLLPIAVSSLAIAGILLTGTLLIAARAARVRDC